ncbi:aldo/keto reductase [Pelagibius litoralis]|uniref:Aldo/keto reductase n=2 Tax=Pelagibius litoralis TaxID=374515 RepID=A0A967CC07_9PROT|nr:aldo/keto reductase [Pelagibius litoralis]
MGCWAIGGPFWNGDVPVGYSGTNDADSTKAVHAAWAAGVRVFDTSAVYGAGHSETLLGEALRDRPDAVIVSKFGHSFDAESKQMTGPQYDAAYIEDSVDQSRRRLQRDRIDVMLLHLNGLAVEDAMPVFDTLEALRSRGSIAAYGWSTDFPDSVNAMAGRDGFIAVQHAMNIFVDAPSLSAAAEAHDLVQLNRSPLAMGVLTGTFSDGRRVPKDDIRSNDADWQNYFESGSASPDYARQLDALRDLITAGGRTLGQGALCWLLAKSPNTLPIPGAKNAEQAEENAAALDYGPLPAEIMAEIEVVLTRGPEGPARAR